MYRHLLVPVDGSDDCVAAIGHATEFARSVGARITFLYIESDDESAGAHGEALLARAEAAARAQGVPASAATVAAPSDIGDEARQRACDVVCLPPRADAPRIGDMPGVAILICPVSATPHADMAMHAMLDAHRALTEVLDEWLALTRSTRASDTAHMRRMIGRVEALFAARTRDGLADWLIAKLRERTSTLDAELEELARLHLREKALLARLAGMAAESGKSEVTDEPLEHAVHALAQFAWERMGRTEGVVLPTARRYLREADWRAISASHESVRLS